MSWLNFNQSLNSIKGQLSNFANTVLAEEPADEEDDTPPISYDILESSEEIYSLERKNGTVSNSAWQQLPEDRPPQIKNNLQLKIALLETEKQELIASLEQLDFDHQQTTDKLMKLKDDLQSRYDELKSDFSNLKMEYGDVLLENMEKTKKIESLNSNDLIQKLEYYEKECEKYKALANEAQEPQELSHLQKESEKLQNLETENEILRTELEKLHQRNQQLQKSSHEYNKEKEILINDFNNLKKEYEDIFHENMEKTKKIESFNSDDLIQKLEYYEKECAKYKALFHEAHKPDQLLNLQKENELIEKLQNLETQDEKLRIELEKLLQHNHQLQESSNNDDKAREILKNDLAALKHSNENINRDYNCLQAKNSELKISLTDLQAMYEKLLQEKQSLHEKYLNIITKNMQKYLNSNTTISPIPQTISDEQPQILEFAGKVETLLKLLSDFKFKTESLENQLCDITQEKNKIISEKNFEIEKLLQNSEILSQEVIGKTQTIKEYEEECADLIKNNDLLISELQTYKNSGLQTISETNEDNLLLMESQLDNANKQIHDLELMISDFENCKQEGNIELQTELEYIKKQLNIMGVELNQSKENYYTLETRYKQLEDDKITLSSVLDKYKSDYENIEYKYIESSLGVESSKEECEYYKTKLNNLESRSKMLETTNFNLESKIELLQNVIDDFKQKLQQAEESSEQKGVQIHNLIERLQTSKMNETTFKLQIDTISKEKQALEQKLHETQVKFDELEIHATSKLQTKLENTEKSKEILENQLAELLTTYDQATRTNNEKLQLLEAQITSLTASRNELITFLQAKHEENVQYHKEIERLNQLLSTETTTSTVPPEEIAQKNTAIENLTEQNNTLREKCETLSQNLLQEQANLQKAITKTSMAMEKEQATAKELERLRVHLVEIEDTYTQELLQAEQKNKDMQAKVNEIEQREKDSSSIYTSVSIRANQQVETLQTQLQLITAQRDDLRVKISDIEDDNNRHKAALTNLQLVLEQFQKDRDKDVQQETERVRRQIIVERGVQDELRNDINNLIFQLEESKQGLQAASRLSDQLEKCKKQIVNLKDELTTLQDQLKKSESKCRDLLMQNDAKVDKSLIKNLVIGYITSNVNDQNQILKIIATVLSFNQNESNKVNLNKPQQGGWLSSILHPQNFNSNSNMSQQTLSEAFVRFLESESQPKVLPNLLTSNQNKALETTSSSSNTTPCPSPLILNEVVLPTFVDFAKSRNSSSILKDVLKDGN